MYFIPFPQARYLVSASPLDDWPRSVFLVTTSAYLAVISLKLFRSVHSGCTLALRQSNPFSLRIFSGKSKPSPALLKAGYRAHYNGPGLTAFLALAYFATAQFLLVIMFKRMDFIF